MKRPGLGEELLSDDETKDSRKKGARDRKEWAWLKSTRCALTASGLNLWTQARVSLMRFPAIAMVGSCPLKLWLDNVSSSCEDLRWWIP